MLQCTGKPVITQVDINFLPLIHFHWKYIYKLICWNKMFTSPFVWMAPLDTSAEWPKTETWGWAKVLWWCSFISHYLSHLNPKNKMSQTISQTEMSFNLQCDNYHILQIKGTLNTLTFYHSYKTNAQLLGSQLKQWNLLGERCTNIIL